MAALHHSSPIDSQCFITVPHSSQLCLSIQRVTSLFPSWHGSILLHSTGYFTVPQLTGLQHGSILLHSMGYFTVPQLTGLQHGSILLHVMGYFTIPQLTGLQHGSRSTGSIVVPSRHGVWKLSGPSQKHQLDSCCLPTFPHLGLQPVPGQVSKAEDFFLTSKKYQTSSIDSNREGSPPPKQIQVSRVNLLSSSFSEHDKSQWASTVYSALVSFSNLFLPEKF